ncbi:hypothetical protein jhhlp_000213 [Lomentospora prolificans]|uniref:Crh-like protein n=1 Tax=Lomentospora prolificans TaxID=41688 RepID=A0A2N3NKA5_9PEZI|nr:hypothetical protein jhhlp_000213 [Lomentospora prolificans]
MRSTAISGALLALLTVVSAQTYTDCDPTKKTCPADPAVGGDFTIDFTKGKNSFFALADGTTLTYDKEKGAVFSIANEKQAPTISSPGYIFFGKLEVDLIAAPGAGIITSIVLQSDCLDEIDWEWLGGSPDEVQTNYFSKGDTSTYDRGGVHAVSASTSTFHTYTIEWTKDALTWSIDGNAVRTLTYADAKGGKEYPQTPMQVKLGTWVAGRSDAPEGTVQWAGGLANFDNGPSNGYYKRVVVDDYMGGNKAAKSYVYSDRTGTWQSITVDTEGNGLEDKQVDDGDDKTTSSSVSKPTGSTNGTATAEPTSSSTSGSDSDSASSTDDSGSDDAAATVAPDSGAAAKTLTFAAAALSGVAILANLF